MADGPDETARAPIDPAELFMLLRRAIPDDKVVVQDRAYINNIAYALQYIDHLLATLDDPDLRPTIHSQTCKSIVLAGMGVVEAILWFVVKAAGQANASDWREVEKQQGRPFARFETTIRIDTVVLEKVSPPDPEEMTLDTLIKKVQARKLLGLADDAVYATLKYLRKLRNRIHIHDVDTEADTDWYTFTGREVVGLLNALNAIFATALFRPEPHHLDLLGFLDPARVERRR